MTYPNYQPYQQMYQVPQRHEVIRVNGRNGADAFQMAPNSSVLLLDETAPIVWLKMTDGAGYPTVTPYSITPYQPEPEISIKTLEERIAKLEEVISNGNKSNHASARKSANESDKTANQHG